jgi:hypothetical protein
MRDAEDRLQVVSHFPGRLRVKARVFRDEPATAAAALQRLQGEPGVTSATSSPLTGSILVLYDPRKVEVGALVAAVLEASELPEVAPDGGEHPIGTRLATRVWQTVHKANEHVFRAAKGNVDLRTVVPSALVCGGVLKLLFTPFAPPQWFDLVFWSYVTFSNLHTADIARHAARTTDADGR